MWVFCSGMMRSGSTLQYQIAKTLVEGAGRGAGIGSCTPAEFRGVLGRHDDPGRTYVLKAHRYIPTAHARLRRGDARCLYVYRDLRDVVVSMMHKESRTFRQMMDDGFVEQLIEDDAVWSRQPNTLVSVYERMTADLAGEVERIAAFLGVDVDRAAVERIAEEHSLDRQKRRIEGFDFSGGGVAEGQTSLLDPDTLLHHNHVRSGQQGQWARELSPEQVAEIERIAGPWLEERGYPLSTLARQGLAARGRRRLERGRARMKRAYTDAAFRSGPAVTGLKVAIARPLRWLSDAVTSPEFAASVGGALYRLTGRRPRSPEPELASAERVLVVRVDEIGDTLLTAPFLRELRRNVPGADITLVVNPGVRNLVDRCPYVDRVLTYDWSIAGLFGRLKRHARALRLARRHLWGRRLDLALLPRWPRDRYHASFVTYFSGARHRVAYSETVTPQKAAMNPGVDRLFTRTLTTDDTRHEVERNLDVIRALGGTVAETGLELWLDDADVARARELLGGDDPLRRPRVALGIGAGSQRRVWPIPRFAEVARALESQHGARVVALGGEGDRVMAESFRQQASDDALDLIGRTTLREAAAVLRQCDLYIGNDTGVMHLAAAAGIPVIEISCHPRTGAADHDHSPARFGPWGVESRVLRPDRPLAPCTDGCTGRIAHCITAVSVDDVLQAATELLHPVANDRERAAGPLH